MVDLRDHQKEAHAATCAAIKAGQDRITLEMATGSGKSYTQAALIEDRLNAQEDVIIVTVPSQDLVSQNAKSYKAFLAQKGLDVNVVGVFAPNEEEMGEHCDMVTTSGDAIAAAKRPMVVIATYASAPALEAAARQGLVADTLIADEAHRMASGEDESNPGPWSKPLFDAFIPAKKRVFYTATLRGETDTGISMNNVGLFGECVYSLGYEKAVELGILEQYVPFVVNIERAELEAGMDQAGIVRGEEETDSTWRAKERAYAASLMADQALQLRRERDEPLSLMAVHPNREMAKMFNDALDTRFQERGEEVPCLLVHGAATQEKNKALSLGRSLTGEMAVSVVDMFREGTDMPGLNTLLVARNAQSSILLVQAMGRVVRLYSKEWADENGYLPKKTPHIFVPVIVDSRDPNDRPDGALAGNLFGAMLRLNDGARQQFQEACAQDGRSAMGGGVEPGQTKGEAALRALAKSFNIDMDSSVGRSIAQSIAQVVSEKETIGKFERFAGMYETWLEKNKFAHPERPTKEEYAQATTPSARAQLDTRRELVLWHQAVMSRHANKMLYKEEADRLYKIPGFFKEGDMEGSRLLAHFQAYKDYTGTTPSCPSVKQEAVMGQRLARVVQEAGILALEGERRDNRGKPLRREKGDASKEEFGRLLAEQEANEGKVPSILGITGPQRVMLRGRIVERVCPQTGRARVGLLPEVGEEMPSGARVKFYQPFIPLNALEPQTQEQLMKRERDVTQMLALDIGFEEGRPVARLVKTSDMEASTGPRLAVVSKPSGISREHRALIEVMERQPTGTRFNQAAIRGKESAPPVVSTGWDGNNADLVRAVARVRRTHAEGRLDVETARQFDKVAGFSWVEKEDYGLRVGKKQGVPMPQAAFKQMVDRAPEASQESILSMDNGVANTVREGMGLIKQMRSARAKVMALEGAEGARAQNLIVKRARDMMTPSIEAFRLWATWRPTEGGLGNAVQENPASIQESNVRKLNVGRV